MMEENKKPSVILFDVNETLLDMSPLKKKVNNILDSKRGFRIWFGMLLQYSLVENCTGQYHDFSTIADANLDMAAKALEKEIEEDEKKEALALMKKLSAYADVEKGLKLLKEAGFRLATLACTSVLHAAFIGYYCFNSSYFSSSLFLSLKFLRSLKICNSECLIYCNRNKDCSNLVKRIYACK